MATLGRAEAGQFNVNSESPRPLAFVHALNRSAPLLLLPLRDVNCAAPNSCLLVCSPPAAPPASPGLTPPRLPRPQSQRRRP